MTDKLNRKEIMKNYYLIIADVFDNTSISNNAKLLYALINNLVNNKGYCYASNEYLALRLDVKVRQIQNLLKQLCDNNYIEIKYSEQHKREIYIKEQEKEKNNKTKKNIEKLLTI